MPPMKTVRNVVERMKNLSNYMVRVVIKQVWNTKGTIPDSPNEI